MLVCECVCGAVWLLQCALHGVQSEGVADSAETSTVEDTEELQRKVKRDLQDVSGRGPRVSTTQQSWCDPPYSCPRIVQLDAKVAGDQRAAQELRQRKGRLDEDAARRSKDRGRLEEAVRHLDGVAKQLADKVPPPLVEGVLSNA